MYLHYTIIVNLFIKIKRNNIVINNPRVKCVAIQTNSALPLYIYILNTFDIIIAPRFY